MKLFDFNGIDSIDIENIKIFADFEVFLKSCENYDEIEINLSKINWFNASLTSIFIAIMRKYQEEKGIKVLIQTNQKIRSVLETNGFFNHNENIKKNWFQDFIGFDKNDTYIPIKYFKKNEDKYFLEYLEQNLKKRHFTNDCLEQIVVNLIEIFSNFSFHSNSEHFYISGQFFPKSQKVNICLTDKGVGLAKYIINNEKNIELQEYAVKWAFQYGNTTRKDEFGGIGLKILKNFIENKKGTLIVYCNNVCYNILENKHNFYNNEFLGTSIFIELPNNC